MHFFFPFAVFSFGFVTAMVGLASIIFSLVMLVDCLKREHAAFRKTFTPTGDFDKIIWTLAILVTSFCLVPAGAIVYFFVVKKAD